MNLHILTGRAKPSMVDVSEKSDTAREAIAEGRICMSQECFERVKEGSMGKGDVLGVARVAGIMAAKKTSELIPLCHLLNLTKVEIHFEMEEPESSIRAICTTAPRKDRCERSINRGALPF